MKLWVSRCVLLMACVWVGAGTSGCRRNYKIQAGECEKAEAHAKDCGSDKTAEEIQSWCESTTHILYLAESDWKALPDVQCENFSREWHNVETDRSSSIAWGASPF